MPKVKKWAFDLRIPVALKPHVEAMAEAEGRSVNNFVMNLIKTEAIKFRIKKGESQPDLFD